MSAMTMEFDGVRELSMEEVDAVAGGPVPIAVFVGIAAAAVVVTGVGYVAGRINGHNANRDTGGACGETSSDAQS